jgi:hypothetical protein
MSSPTIPAAMTTHSVIIAAADALPFALVGAIVAFLGGRRLAGPAFALPLAGLVGVALLASLGAISLSRVADRPFVCCRTTANVLWFS